MQHKVRLLTASFPLIMLGKYKAIPVLAWTGLEVSEDEGSQISRKSAHVDAPPGTSRYSFH